MKNTTEAEQTIALGDFLLDEMGIERRRNSFGGQAVALTVGASAIALAEWGIQKIAGAWSRQ